MKRDVVFVVFLSACGVAAASAAACSSSSGGGTPGPDASTEGGSVEGGPADGGGGVSFAPVWPCTDTIDSIYADPGDVSAKKNGDLIKCAKDKDFAAADLQSIMTNTTDGGTPAYAGKTLTSGAHTYRILYRTERGDTANTPGYSSATVYIPDTPRKGPTTALPLVVATHGSRGQAGKCAPSKFDPDAFDVFADYEHLVYPFVGFGFPVVAPDLAGYANYGGTKNPPSAYDSLEDVGKSNLDGLRALRQLIPSASSDKVIIAGHSQGGYSALATLALSDAYGSGGTVSAVAVYAPIWLSQQAWAAVFVEPTVYTFDKSAVGPVSIWYHYTHAELLDGPGHGIDLFQPAKQATVKSFVDNDCWGDGYTQLVEAGTSANDFFLPSYTGAVGPASTPLKYGDCGGDATCEKWRARMIHDWPHLTGNAAKAPVLLWYANNDSTVTPDGMQCVFNRLQGDGANYKVCYDPTPFVTNGATSGHSGPPAVDNNYVIDWVAQQTLGDPAPTEACASLAPNEAGVPQITDEAGAPIDCNGLLPTE
jgi:pimeloyl-ACP methyl ester carboxylesterase